MTSTSLQSTSGVDDGFANSTRWMTAATLFVGIVNYVYALVLTRVLDTADYAVFAAGQALLLVVGTVATASIPWVVAHELATDKSDEHRRAILWFAVVANIGQSLIAGLIIAVASLGFAGPSAIVAMVVGTATIFMASTVIGWLQGDRRFKAIALLRMGEVGIKAFVGVVLALTAIGAAGALGAFAVGAGLQVVFGIIVLRKHFHPRRQALLLSRVWKRVAGVASVQGLVAVVASVDVVLVASLAAASGEIAGYQASVIFARVPLFFAAAVAAVIFPAFAAATNSERSAILAKACRSYIMLSLPITIAFVTVPSVILDPVFPSDYQNVKEILRFTAIAGFSLGMLSLLTVFLQASSLFKRSVTAQVAGLVIHFAALFVGYSTDGVSGLAIGAAVGSIASLLLVGIASYGVWRDWLKGVPFLLVATAIGGVALNAAAGVPLLWVGIVVIAGAGCALLALKNSTTEEVA